MVAGLPVVRMSVIAAAAVPQESSGDLDLATFSMLETQTSELSSQARTCFTRAEEIAVADAAADETYDDRWLHHYMLGKMADKDDHSLDKVLAHYQKVSGQQSLNG